MKPLTQQFVTEAEKLHGWYISFAGEVSLNEVVRGMTYEQWKLLADEPLELQLARNEQRTHRDYSLVSQNKERKIASVYLSRERDYQPKLLDAVIMHLKILPEDTRARVHLPEELGPHVSRDHIDLLASDEQYDTFRMLPGPLYICSKKDDSAVFPSLRIRTPSLA